MGARRAAIAVTIGLIIGIFKTTRNNYKSNGTIQEDLQLIREGFEWVSFFKYCKWKYLPNISRKVYKINFLLICMH